ncbi:Bug family tripartite tricarboxylate transporter substrate binding protein [Roseococcus sp.]|uniref:Bug family tripartite tricarboxylate transporter substrate binding protein n=1 Tax=Roseococcus sp. TaxID=2109646 RepID=UPI003BAD9162
MNATRRGLLAAGLPLPIIRAARAQDWPAGRTIRVLVGYPAGGPTDLVARLVAAGLRDAIGAPVIVENRGGASGSIGAVAAARAEPDGTTLWLGPVQTQVLNPLLMRNISYDPLKDFVGIGTVAALPNALVVNPRTLDVRSVQELIERGKREPGALTYGTYGAGSSPHMFAVLLQKIAGFEALQVPYQGSAPASTALLAGDISFLFDNITTTVAQAQGGRVRPLAVTSRRRSPAMPSVPTMEEAGVPGFNLNFWFALYAPVQTPAPIVARLREALARAVATPEFAQQLAARGADPFVTPEAELQSFFESEARSWAALVRDAGLRPE